MPKGRGRQKIDRRAVAAANGYVRGANREQDQHRCETFYSPESIALQDRVISVYILWASEEDENPRDEGLQKGQPVPDLATIKDFMRFYIFSSRGMISLRSTKSSVLNFAERFFAGYTRLTKSVFDKKDTQDVFKWIARSLVKEEIIEDKRRAKHMFTHCDLTNIIVSLWTDDDPVFIHPRYRVQLTYAILIYCYSGARIGTFIPDTSKADERGLRYEDIELYIYCRPDSEIELFFRLSKIWVKNNDNPKNTVFRLAMREHRKLRFNPVAFLLEMVFQDGAFLHFDSLETLKRWNPDHNEPIPLLWKPSVAKEPVLRTVTRFGGISKRPWTRECFCRLFRAVVINAGYPEIITIHSLRRGLANRLDKVATEAERSQVLTQKDPNIFGRSYIDSTSALSTMDAFLGEAMRVDHIEYLRGVGKYRALGYPRHLPAERQHAIQQNEDLRELERRLQELKIQQTANNDDNNADSGEDEDGDGSAVDGDDEEAKFAIELTKKQVQVLKTRLHNAELAKYREEWIQDRLETQVRSGGKASEEIMYNDVTHCLFKAQPERQRVAEMMPSDKSLSYQDMLSVVKSLLSYCTKDYDVFYRPGEEPLNGRCSVGGCNLVGLTRPKRSNHVQDCQLKECCKALRCKETQLKYCYECFGFSTAEQWEEHCKNHLEHNVSRRCEIIIYCYTLIRPGYCPLCIGNESLAPSQRMNAWKQSNELRAHVNKDIEKMDGNYFCSHPMCQVKFDSEMQLRYHLNDIHGLHKAIWDGVDDSTDSRKEAAQENASLSTVKKRRQGRVKQRDKKRPRVGHGQAEGVQIIQWECPGAPSDHTPDPGVPTTANKRRSSPSDNLNKLVTKFWIHHAENALCPIAEDPDKISARKPKPIASDGVSPSNKVHHSYRDDFSLCASDWSSFPDLTTSVGSESSTTCTSPNLLPIDPQILRRDNVPLTGLDGHELDSREANRRNEPEC